VEHWASPAALAAHERNEAFIHFGQEVLVRHATLHALYCPIFRVPEYSELSIRVGIRS
jgi:hypothetical protein